MAPAPRAPPKGSQTISSFFQRVERPPSSSSSASAGPAPSRTASSSAAQAGQRRPASPSNGSASQPPVKRARLSAPQSTSLAEWRYLRPAPGAAETQTADDADVAAAEEDEAAGTIAMPADVQPADASRHARFVKLLYATSRSEHARNYGYLSNQTMRREHEDGDANGGSSGAGPSASEGARSRFFAGNGQDDAAGADKAAAVNEENEFTDDSDEDLPDVVSTLSKFAHGSASGAAKKASGSGAAGARAAKGKGKAKADEGNGVTYTPLETQILKLKEDYPGVLLIIEVGYKLKFYGDDARIASRELNIACFPEKNLLTAMIPVHRLHVHIRKLIAAGYKVGVVRQTETRALKAVSANRSQPFTRALTAMYTASTWIDDIDPGAGPLAATEGREEGGLEEPTALRSVVCILERPEGGGGTDERVSIGLVSVSVSTGDVVYDQFVDGNLRSELETRIAHLNPAELLLPDTRSKAALSKQTEKLLRFIADQNLNRNGRSSMRVERFNDGKLTQNEAVNLLEEFYTRGPASIRDGDQNSRAKSQSRGASAAKAIRIDDSDEAMSEPAASTSAPQEAGSNSGAAALPTILKLPHLCLISLAHLIKHLSSFFSLSSVFTQPTNFTSFENRTTMLLTANTIHNLEIFQNATDGRRKGSLIWLLDRCKTMMGRRLLRRWIARPLTDITALEARVDAVEELGRPESSVGGRLAAMLQGTPDLERGLAKLNYGALTPTELATMLLALNRIAHEFGDEHDGGGGGGDGLSRSAVVNENVAMLPLVRGLVKRAMGAVNVAEARKGNKKDLFVDPDLYPAIQDAKDNILVMESELREHLKEVQVRVQLKRPKLEYISVAGNDFLIEVRTADATKVPADWLRISATKSMVRFHTPHVRQLMAERERHIEMLDAAAEAGYKAFLETIKEDYVLLRNVVSALATLDALLSLVLVSQLPGYCKPIFNEDNVTRIEGLRHPMSEQLMGSDFVPNDVVLGDKGSEEEAERASTVLLTGSNMGGKSSIARATALVSILAQIGSFVPADSARLPIHDAVLTRMGASDMLAKGRSTFMVEVVETADIMRAATERSLVIIDELGRGTSTYDGLAIAYAVLEYLVQGAGEEQARRPQMFFITHNFQLCELEGQERYRGLIRNMHMAVLEVEAAADETSGGSTTAEPQIVFLYKLQAGAASKSLGINCARLAGLPEPVLVQAAKKSVEMEVLEQRERAGRQASARLRLVRALFRGADELPALEAAKRVFLL